MMNDQVLECHNENEKGTMIMTADNMGEYAHAGGHELKALEEKLVMNTKTLNDMRMMLAKKESGDY